MPQMNSPLIDESQTDPEHWIRGFDIIENDTEYGTEHNVPLLYTYGCDCKTIEGDKELTRAIAITSAGTTCSIYGYTWKNQRGYEVIPLNSEATRTDEVQGTGLGNNELDGTATPQLEALAWIKDATGLSDEDISTFIGVSRPTIDAWRNGGDITTTRLRRLLAVRDVLERAATRLPSKEHLRAWLVTPRGADGRTPEGLLRANEIDQARLLAMSMPSPKLQRPPSRVRQSIPADWWVESEGRNEPEPLEEDQDVPAVRRTKGTKRTVIKRRD